VNKLNLIDGLNQELKRAKELLEQYNDIPTGAFGATVINNAIEFAEICMQENDPIELIMAYEALKNLE